jgi:hypothetical protein
MQKTVEKPQLENQKLNTCISKEVYTLYNSNRRFSVLSHNTTIENYNTISIIYNNTILPFTAVKQKTQHQLFGRFLNPSEITLETKIPALNDFVGDKEISIFNCTTFRGQYEFYEINEKVKNDILISVKLGIQLLIPIQSKGVDNSGDWKQSIKEWSLTSRNYTEEETQQLIEVIDELENFYKVIDSSNKGQESGVPGEVHLNTSSTQKQQQKQKRQSSTIRLTLTNDFILIPIPFEYIESKLALAIMVNKFTESKLNRTLHILGTEHYIDVLSTPLFDIVYELQSEELTITIKELFQKQKE